LSGSGKHSANRLGTYLTIHDTVMSRFEDEGAVEDHLEWTPQAGALILGGWVGCRGGFRIDVWKRVDVWEQAGIAWARTRDYAYNVGRGDVAILRYDSAHAHPGQNDRHHVHGFDPRTGEELNGSPRWVGGDWPTLGEVIQEVLDLAVELHDDLTDPLAFPEQTGDPDSLSAR